jgi:hypothetical protein
MSCSRREVDPITKRRGRVTGVALVDFSSVGLASPVTDFVGFMRTSLRVRDLYEPDGLTDRFSATYALRLWPQLPEELCQCDLFTIRERAVALAKTLNFFAEPTLWRGSPDLEQRRVRALQDATSYAVLRRRFLAHEIEAKYPLNPHRAALLIRMREFERADARYRHDIRVRYTGTATTQASSLAMLRDTRKQPLPLSLM